MDKNIDEIEQLPLISILIPVYNREEIVRRAVRSAVRQTYRNLEIIVTDNCSTDATWDTLQALAAEDDRIKIFRNDKNLGPVLNWFECLRHVTGEYVKFLWSDDEIAETFIDRCYQALSRDSSLGFAYTRTEIILKKESFVVYGVGATGAYPTEVFVEKSFAWHGEVPVSPGCAMFRAKDVQACLPGEIKNPKRLNFLRFGAGNDQSLFLNVCDRYPNFYYIDETLSFFYGGDDSITINNKIEEYYCYAMWMFAKRVPRFASYKPLLVKRIRECGYRYMPKLIWYKPRFWKNYILNFLGVKIK